MKRIFALVAVAAMLVASAATAAAQKTTGTVKSFDAAKQELTLKGKKKEGVVYVVPTSVKDPGLKPGARVIVTWEDQDGKHMVSALALAPPKQKKPKQNN